MKGVMDVSGAVEILLQKDKAAQYVLYGRRKKK